MQKDVLGLPAMTKIYILWVGCMTQQVPMSQTTGLSKKCTMQQTQLLEKKNMVSEILPNMPAARRYLQAKISPYDGNLYVFGGNNTSGSSGGNQKTLYKYYINECTDINGNQLQNTWEIIKPIDNTIDNYFSTDCNKNKWEFADEIPQSLQMRDGAAVVYQDKIYLIGGSASPTVYCTWDETRGYSPTETISDSDGTTFESSYNGNSAIVHNGKLHVLGSNGKDKKIHIIFDEENNIWEEYKNDSGTAVKMPYNFSYGAALSYHGTIHIFSGSGDGNGHYFLDEDISSPTCQTWVKLPDLNGNSVTGAACYEINGNLYVHAGNFINKFSSNSDSDTFSQQFNLGQTTAAMTICKNDDTNEIYIFNNNDFAYKYKITDYATISSTGKICITNNQQIVNANHETIIEY